mmetsp:Transcript_91743/g.204880  ORF Transcript_91743/g.204880 Transcript_91743/m.204880 type:complete len:270 (+) Transcript_91743:157-966(+)
MQQGMLDMLAEVHQIAREDPQSVGAEILCAVQEDSERLNDLSGPSSTGLQGGVKAVPPAGPAESSLGWALKQGREEARIQERRRLLEELGAPSAASKGRPVAAAEGSGMRQALTARHRAKQPPQRSPRVANARHPGAGSKGCGGGKELAPRIVHRHHHHHYHHHYVLVDDDGNAINGPPASLQEPGSWEPHPPWEPPATARMGDHQNFHYHHHIGEEEVPPRVQRLLIDAKKGIPVGGDGDLSGGRGRGAPGQPGAGRGNPDTQLPRLS